MRAVLVTHSETSTGILHPVQAIAGAVHANSDALVVVDAVSSAGATPLAVDAWGLDVVCTGSQKALMSPPGMAILSISPRAWNAYKSARAPRFFWDWSEWNKWIATGMPYVIAKAAMTLDGRINSPPDSRWISSKASRRDAMKLRRRVAVCVDTCHVFAAGYDITTEDGYRRTLDELEATTGLGNVHAFHLNDSQKPLGCRVDRHEHIGRGEMGLEPFRMLVNDERFTDLPAFLETEARFRENLGVLRSLRR